MIEKKLKDERKLSLDVLEYNHYYFKIEENNDKAYSLKNKIHLREIFYRFRGKHLFPDRG